MKEINQLAMALSRPQVKGKFIYCGDEKFYIKGVTYGTFAPTAEGHQFPGQSSMERDLAMMKINGINCIRTYTVPPPELLNLAHSLGMKVMVGLPWEQHITFLDGHKTADGIIKRVKDSVKNCFQHPAILCYAVGNEIPPSIVRWYGKKRIEHFLKRLHQAVKQVDPESLVTYVNYPTTEYLNLDFLDFDCFNVYLETPEKLSKYISRLHNLGGDRPLVLAEIGLDSNRNGLDKQADILTWQIETIYAGGCAGMFVFSWTDEWWRGGFEIEDWDFGLVERDRKPKPALHAVSLAMESIPFNQAESLPFISIIVCSYNGSATIRDTLTGIQKLDYPNYEVIVVNDGSKDSLASIVREYPFRLISTVNRGLSSARNTGMYASRGEIIAYIDDDAYPDPHWLRYLAYAYSNSDHACIGGPNIAPDDDGFIATCVANAPGGPVHVLLSDEIAEHVPGCNMSFRRSALMKIGGFDPVYRAAGDDVDVCWRIQESGRTIGFHPSAVVWHHRRNSFKAYWNQQKGYGKAEALLEAKWPEKYNTFGHLTWAGRIYGNGLTLPIKVKKDKIFHGTWGTALFQSVYQQAGSFWTSIPLMPEWYLFSTLVAVIASMGFLWSPLLWLWPVFALALSIVIIQASISAKKNTSLAPWQKKKIKYRLFIICLHIVQPMARLYGRLKYGLTPWRKRGAGFSLKFIFVPFPKLFTYWSENWRPAEDWLKDIESNIIDLKARVKRGDEFSSWDIEVKTGLFVKCRGLLSIEEHGAGKQMLKFRCKAHYPSFPLFIFLSISALAIFAGFMGHWVVMVACLVITLSISRQFLVEASSGMNSLFVGFEMMGVEDPVKEVKIFKKEDDVVMFNPEYSHAQGDIR